MGFHDHLYASNYYNEEELLTSDEYPPALVNICARYCVNHLSKTLLEKIPVPMNEAIEPQISTESSSSRTTQPAVETPPAITGYLPTKQYRLRPGVCLPSELSEKIFAYLGKHTTAAELLRGGDSSSSSSGSSSSSSGGSSSSEDEADEERGMEDGDRGNGEGNVDVLRRRRRRRRRRMRRRGMVLVNEQHVRMRRSGGGGRRKKRMLWNGGIVGGDGDNKEGAGNPDQQEISEFEVVGFDDIVEPLFGNPHNLPLTKLNLRTSTAVNDDILKSLLAHRPRELDIHECPKLTSSSLETINSNSQNLVSLVIGTSTQILPTMFLSPTVEQGFLSCPKLMKLVIWNLTTNVSLYWGHLTTSFANTLTSLDLSGCGEFEDFEFLRKCGRVRSLVLYNVLISGRVPGERKVSNGDIEDDEMVGEGARVDRSSYVLFLKDEEEGPRLHGGGGGRGREDDGEDEPHGRGDDEPEDDERVRDPVGYVAFRRRLEGLVNKLISPICQLKDLRFLDISTSSDPSTTGALHVSPHSNNLIGSDPTVPWSTYPNPNQVLSTLVQNLPKLTHLDISGTNLAGRGVAVLMNQAVRVESVEESGSKLCDIPGLNSRVDNPLEFLGLYGTAHDASHRHCIPAKRISGDKDETQILVACEAYIHRHEVLEKVLNDLFHLFRSERGTHITQSLRLILRAMNLHPSEKHVQISGSASLFYIVKNEQHSQASGGSSGGEVINPPMKRMILSTIVNAMAIHKVDSTMARNGCLTICHFRIPQDVMFIYAKLVKILLKILGQSIGPHQRHESFVERIAIYLLNSLACQVEGWHKRLVGDLGAMKRMLQLIQDRLTRLECDDVMEIAWSTMWNVTDETPENCEKFLKNEGMKLFLKCLQTFPNKPELLRNMMGLLGNVAEVGPLRKQLMTSEFISVFCELLDSTQDNIEVSYNAAGVLAHILSDGAEAWGIATPSRDVIQQSMVKNVNRWNINSTRNINYRSFEPILRLLRINHTRECQLWASWALANLTRVYPEKYVPLVEKENGLSPLHELLEEPLNTHTATEIQEDVKKYAKITFENVAEFKKSGQIDRNNYMDG